MKTTSFFPLWLLLFFQEDFEAKGDFFKSGNQEKSSEITGLSKPLATGKLLHYHLNGTD